jgi:hypothetical protein
MATSAELRPGFEYDLEYKTGGSGLDEFEPEHERDAVVAARGGDRVEVQLNGFEARAPSGGWHRFGMKVATAALVVAAVVWLAVWQPAPAPAPNAPLDLVPAAAAPAPVPSVASQPAVAVSEAAVEPREVAPEGARPAAKPQPKPQPRQATAAPPHAVSDPPSAAIDHTLAGVSQAYRALDAAALGAVWPGADAAALSRQFSSLKYQSLSFDACEMRASGPEQAVVSCAVSIAAAAKEGDPSLQQRRESWTIVLARKGDRYLITGVSTRRG